MHNPFSHPDSRKPFEAAPQAEVHDELAFHLEQRIRDYVSRGMDPATARATALERFGNVTEVQRECAQMLADERRADARRDWFEDLRQDIRFGLRSAARAKLFTALAVLTLALGIGANAAVFGVVKSVLLDALPYREPQRLVRVYARFRDGSSERGALSAGAANDVGIRQRSFSKFAVFQGEAGDRIYKDDGGASIIHAAWVQPAFLSTLGVVPALGRDFHEEDARGDTSFTTIITHEAWQRVFGRDPRIVGRTILINGIARQVVGVLPRDFVSPVPNADIYYALSLPALLSDPISARGSHYLAFIGRLEPGVSVEHAHQDVDAISTSLSREYPRDDGPFQLTTTPLRDAMVGDTRTPLLVLMASAGLVLLITCANLAGALLSRTISRRKEFAVRVALGAGRGRLVRQLLTESTLLALTGGLAGILLALVGLSALRTLALHALPSYAHLALDSGTLVCTMVLALCTGIAFGIFPALSVGRANMQSTLRDETRGTSESRRSRRLRGALVAGQIALCLSLLAGAGLLARSLWAMTSTPLGFNPDGLLTADVQPGLNQMHTSDAMAGYYARLEDQLRAVPGVTAIASASELPSGSMNSNGLVIEGATPPPNDQQSFITYVSVSDDYFRTLGIPLRSGRTFGPEDRPDAPSSIVISAAMERRYWPNGGALGARIRLGPDANAPWKVIVGVVGDVRNDPLRATPEPITYASRRQEPTTGVSFIFRARGNPLALAAPIKRAAAAFDADLAAHNIATMRSLLSDGLAGRRLPVVLMTAFGALALVLASVGVYAMFAAMAAAREREFSVRVALGSSREAIAGLVLKQGAVWMAAGLAGGIVGVVLVGSLLRNLLFGVRPLDPVTLGATAMMLLACATLALFGPVRRATRVDATTVLH
ncbi:MAG TPA: ABC transporter permease [Gemmatimonadaceae bacterium]